MQSERKRRCIAVGPRYGAMVAGQRTPHSRRPVKQGGGKDAVQEAYRAGTTYLQQELGITQQSELVRILDIGTSVKYRCSFCLPPPIITTTAAMNPNSLFNTNRSKLRKRNINARPLDVDADMRPAVECLLKAGFTKEQICKVFLTTATHRCPTHTHCLFCFS